MKTSISARYFRSPRCCEAIKIPRRRARRRENVNFALNQRRVDRMKSNPEPAYPIGCFNRTPALVSPIHLMTFEVSPGSFFLEVSGCSPTCQLRDARCAIRVYAAAVMNSTALRETSRGDPLPSSCFLIAETMACARFLLGN